MSAKRNKQIKAYVTQEELEVIKLQAQLEGLTQSEYLAKQALKPSSSKDDTNTTNTNEQLLKLMSQLVDSNERLCKRIDTLEAKLDKESTASSTTTLTVGSYITGEDYHKQKHNSWEIPKNGLDNRKDPSEFWHHDLWFLPELGVLACREASKRNQWMFRVLKIYDASFELPVSPSKPSEPSYEQYR